MAASNKQRKKAIEFLKGNNEAVEAALKHLLQNAVFSEELKEIIDIFADKISELKDLVKTKNSSNKGDIEKSEKKLQKEITALQTKLEKKIREEREGLEKKINSLKEGFDNLKESLDNSEESFDYTADAENTKKVLEALEERFTAENIRNALEVLQGDDRLNAKAIIVEITEGNFVGLDVIIKELLGRVRYLSSRGGAGSTMGGGATTGAPSPRHALFDVGSATTSITLPTGVAAQGNAIFVRYQGQLLNHGVDYSVNGIEVTFIDYSFVDDTEVSVTWW